MATPPKRWPTNAEWARMDAISAGSRSMAILQPILEEDLSWSEVYRRVGQAISESAKIVIALKEVGPGMGSGNAMGV